MPEPTNRHRRIARAAILAGAVMTLASAPGAAQAQVASAAGDAGVPAAEVVEVAAVARAPVVATFFDAPLPDLDGAALSLYETQSQVFEATLTANLLQSVGDATRMAGDGRRGVAKPPVDPFRVQPPVGAGQLAGGFAAGGLAAGGLAAGGLAAIANPSFGSRDSVAVSITPRLVSSTELHTDIRLRHSGDLVDAGFDLAASQSLVSPDPARVRYDSHALVSVAPAMQLGLAARGSLGTVAAPMLGRDGIAGPLLRLNLTDSNLSLGSDLGYDFDLNPANAAARNQVHFKLNLKLKL